MAFLMVAEALVCCTELFELTNLHDFRLSTINLGIFHAPVPGFSSAQISSRIHNSNARFHLVAPPVPYLASDAITQWLTSMMSKRSVSFPGLNRLLSQTDWPAHELGGR